MTTTANRLLNAANQHGLRLAPDLRLDDTGADFLVGQGVDEEGTAWVVRVPRRPDVLQRAEYEQKVLRLVRSHLRVAVPDWRVFSSEVIAYPRLDGDPAAVIDLDVGGYVWRLESSSPPDNFVNTLAETISSLHCIPKRAAENAGLRIEESEQVREQWTVRFEEAREMLDVPDRVWQRWQDWLTDESIWPTYSVLIHGDLHPPHILIDELHRVTGLLDWTEGRVSDPATDFALLFATMGHDALGKLLDVYNQSGAPTWPRIYDHVVETWSAYPAVLAEFAKQSGEQTPRDLAQTLISANAAEGDSS